jgi:hypothetical protein
MYLNVIQKLLQHVTLITLLMAAEMGISGFFMAVDFRADWWLCGNCIAATANWHLRGFTQ